ncbi:MgtC/SapB family protein [Archangium gephyra]|uniref:MgtC/SapB family protein n=1 Tax=Archangium gephyra TaxID=48 RepID=UPI003B820FA7
MEGLDQFPGMLLRLAVAFALALPVGWEREHRKFSPGLRTFPLVATGACAFLLIAQHVFPGEARAQAYAFQAVLSGIGFIGGGAILKGQGNVKGIATAVCIWITAAVGVAVAYGLYLLGATLSLTTLVALQLLKPLKEIW